MTHQKNVSSINDSKTKIQLIDNAYESQDGVDDTNSDGKRLQSGLT